MTEHTPTPWEIIPLEGSVKPWTISGPDPEGVRYRALAITQDGDSIYEHLKIDEATQKANAAFIVRAVNSHEQLVAALEAFLDVVELSGGVGGLNNASNDDVTGWGSHFLTPMVDKARAALATAKGDE